MEKTIISENKDQSKTYKENIFLFNRKNLHIEGISEIISTSETGLYMKLRDTNLSISGENIHICKLDVSTGILEAEGNFLNIKYGKSTNIFKRVFK